MWYKQAGNQRASKARGDPIAMIVVYQYEYAVVVLALDCLATTNFNHTGTCFVPWQVHFVRADVLHT